MPRRVVRSVNILLFAFGVAAVVIQLAKGQAPAQPQYVLGPEDAIEIVVWDHGDLVPRSEDRYTLGPGDSLDIEVWPQSDFSRKVVIGPDGQITIPPLGEFRAVGLTPVELSSRVSDQLRRYVKDARITVVVSGRKLDRSNPFQAFGRARTVAVRFDGKISLPVLDELDVSGQTPHQVAERIARGLESYVKNPRVSVIVKEFKGKRVSILGQVRNPGHYKLREETRLFEAIAIAGGHTFAADLSSILVTSIDPVSGRSRVTRINAERGLRGEDDSNILLQPNDVIFVPGTLKQGLEALKGAVPNIQIQIQMQSTGP